MAMTPAFEAMMSRLRAGDDDAARQVYEQCSPSLIALASRRLPRSLTAKEDPEDVIQSVYRSFFRRLGAGAFRLEGWDGLWGILTVMTARKCVNRKKYYEAGRRRVGREVSLASDPRTDAAGLDVADREPSPDEAAMLAETVEQLTADLEPWQREMIVLHLQGHTAVEISRRVGRAERTVRRNLDNARDRLSQLRELDMLASEAS